MAIIGQVVKVLIIALAMIVSVCVILLFVGGFLFTAATANSDPNEQGEPIIMFLVMLVVIGIVVGGWTVFIVRRRSVGK